MTEQKFLENLTGEPWTGIRFLEMPSAKTKSFFRFCEAVSCSFNENLIIVCEEMECIGALRTFGLGWHDGQMARQMSEKTGMSLERAKGLLEATPILARNIRAIELGTIDSPDVLLGYLQPESSMRLLRCWQQTTGRRLITNLSAFTAVCASLAAADQDCSLVFSFGCPDSRQYGGIRPEYLVAALPREVVTQMMQEMEDYANV